MEPVQENLVQYIDNKFFNSLLEQDTQFADKNYQKDDKKGKDDKKDNKDNKDDGKNPEKNEKQLQADSEEKKGLAVIKKLEDNYKHFKTVAGDKIIQFKNFWDVQQNVRNRLAETHNFQYSYAMYDSNYVVILATTAQADKPTLSVIQKQLGTGTKNPFLTFTSKSVINAFVNFYKFVEKDMKTVKHNYKTSIEDKKLDSFLKESIKKTK